MSRTEAPSPHRASPHTSLKDQLLSLLTAGPSTTTTLTKIVAMQELGLDDSTKLTEEPYRSRFKQVRKKVLRSLNQLERQKRVIGEDLIVGSGPDVALQVRWWRLPLAREWRSGKVDKALSRRLAQRIWPQITPSLARMQHWQRLLQQQSAASKENSTG